MSLQRNWRHFIDINFPRGKHRPHLSCQQFLAVYATLSHYLICEEFFINHKEQNESIILLRMDTALLIFLALYQHWWNKPRMVPVKLKQRVGLSLGEKDRAKRSSQWPSALWRVRVRASTEVRMQCVEKSALHPLNSRPPLTFSCCLQRTVALKPGRPIVWGSMENVFSSQISINQHTSIFFNYLHRADLIWKSLCNLKNVSPICQICIIYEVLSTQRP